jgi:hypothetical protein
MAVPLSYGTISKELRTIVILAGVLLVALVAIAISIA